VMEKDNVRCGPGYLQPFLRILAPTASNDDPRPLRVGFTPSSSLLSLIQMKRALCPSFIIRVLNSIFTPAVLSKHHSTPVNMSQRIRKSRLEFCLYNMTSSLHSGLALWWRVPHCGHRRACCSPTGHVRERDGRCPHFAVEWLGHSQLRLLRHSLIPSCILA
jgi:hypothetical protein